MSTRQLTDASQEITDGYTYDAFGILLNKFGATVNDYLYTGEQYDPNVGFYYLRARYYNASIGRFLTMDDFPGLMFEPLSLHKYLYCEGNPITRQDPFGLFSLSNFIMSNHLYVWLTTTVINVLLSSIAFLVSLKNDAEWSGATIQAGFSGSTSFGFSIGIARYKGVRETEKGTVEGSGIWLVVIFGHQSSYVLSKDGRRFGFSWSYYTPTWFRSPGIIGVKKGALTGLVSWSSLGFNIPKKLGKWKYFGLSGSFMMMGFGWCASVGIIGGRSIGINLQLMGGFSIPLYFRGGE